MDGRFYDGRLLKAFIATGGERFKKSRKDNEEEEQRRHEEYARWLESQD